MARKKRLIRFRSVLPYAGMTCLVVFTPASTWAVQHHGWAEGLVVHQIGHFLFISGMLFFLYRLSRDVSGPGWTEFKAFLWLIVLWNILTFCGHWQRKVMDPDKFIRVGGHIRDFIITSPADFLFYFTRLDHLLLVPAFFFLLVAVNKWRKQK